MYLFFDTETTGLPLNYKAPVTDAANWPRIVQIAWLLTDDQGNELAAVEYIVKPEGFVIPPDVAKIHGITTEAALQNGQQLATVLDAAAAAIGGASVLIAHNIEFDEKILGAEFLRAGRPNAVDSRPRRCTMKEATDFCAIPGPKGFKWPGLAHLHTKLFGESFEGAHRALVDVRACARCYFELKRLKVMA